MIKKENYFIEMEDEIKLCEIPLNQVTFLKIFSSYLDSIGVKCVVEKNTEIHKNSYLFELNLFCHFYYSISINLNEKELKKNLFELIDLDPKTLIKKTDIIIIRKDEMSSEVFNLSSLDIVFNDNFYFIFIKRIQNEFEMRMIFDEFQQKYNDKIEHLKLHYLMPKFCVSKDFIGKNI